MSGRRRMAAKKARAEAEAAEKQRLIDEALKAAQEAKKAKAAPKKKAAPKRKVKKVEE
tara:strand:- start:345 stop:518 length:174 start_codon:yes stop_codon:yes gene_type:complete